MEHKILSLIDSCTGCFACQNACPVDAISLPENEEGFYFPVVATDKCINCGLCDKICPAINEPEFYHMQKAYYGWANDDVLRRNSSSGGMFGLLAKHVQDLGGVAFGAAFNYDDLRLECKSTDSVPLLELQKSKYVQCHVGDGFRNIKETLKSGKQVLYCGTPCEVSGLRCYLREDDPNLLCVDFVCHGVPPVSLLREHLTYKGIKNVKRVDFRPKNRAWVDDIVVDYKNNKQYQNSWSNDEFYKLFENYGSIRRSCYSCQYCNGNKMSDISLADFWGYRDFDKSIFDKRGISLVLANTEKGVKWMDMLIENEDCFIKEIGMEYAEYVYARDRKAPQSNYNISFRNKFFQLKREKGYKYALKKMGMMTPFVDQLKYYIRSEINKFHNK